MYPWKGSREEIFKILLKSFKNVSIKNFKGWIINFYLFLLELVVFFDAECNALQLSVSLFGIRNPCNGGKSITFVMLRMYSSFS